jgi:DNA-binding NarL/FixJ family response regulator
MARGVRSEPAMGRLPADLTNFIGRRQELAQIKRLLSMSRLVTLIAAKLVVAQRTAESHVENILRKLEFGSRAQVAVWYAERARPGGL